MSDPLENARTMQGEAAVRDTIGDMLTQRPDAAVMLAGRYRIVRKLGEGGMGSVWLAEDTKLDGRQVAIKMLPVVLVANKRAIEQLKAEAKVAIQLAHPNIATLRAFEESDQGPFLVMDYISGQNLEDILAGRGALPHDEVVRIFEPVANALDYAHCQRVIHRDVKPSNILIREDGTPFITDFGIAREMKDTMTRVTGRSTSGTVPYMSPEQLRGQAPSPSQDIYSLAATMYECFAGHPPFHRGQIEYQIVNEAPPPLLADRGPVVDAIHAALSKAPEQRPQCCSEILVASSTPSPVAAGPHPTAAPSHEDASTHARRPAWWPTILLQIIGAGLFYVAPRHRLRFLYLAFPLYAALDAILGPGLRVDPFESDEFGFTTFIVALILHALASVHVLVTTHGVRRQSKAEQPPERDK